MNAHLPKIQIEESELAIIAEKRYAKKKESEKRQYDLGAYKQRIRDQIERTLAPKCSVDSYGRLYVPMTSMYRELWNFVYY